MAKMSAEVGLAEVVMQQKLTNRLLAAQLKATMKQTDLIALLAGTGAAHQEIAEIVGTTAATVSNALVRTRKRAPSESSRR